MCIYIFIFMYVLYIYIYIYVYVYCTEEATVMDVKRDKMCF